MHWLASVAVTVKFAVECEVGVPVISPLELSDNPAGNEPVRLV